MEARPGAAEILSEPCRWSRIGGREMRRSGQHHVIQSERVPLHPEFNGWSLNVMQTHVMTPRTSLTEDSLRLYFRVAMKSQLNLQVGRGCIEAPAWLISRIHGGGAVYR